MSVWHFEIDQICSSVREMRHGNIPRSHVTRMVMLLWSCWHADWAEVSQMSVQHGSNFFMGPQKWSVGVFKFPCSKNGWADHDDIIKWKHFPHYWLFVQGIHRSPVNSPHKGQWRRALMSSLICTRINGWVNNGEAGDLRLHHAHYDVTVMCWVDVGYVNQTLV